MPKQKGLLKMKGTMGDITFYKTKDGYLAKEKSDIGDKLKTGAEFQRTRENNSEFGRAGKAVKTLRNAFRVLLQNSADSRMTSRLQKEMMKVIQADATSIRGQRNVVDGKLEMLKGFDFNLYAKLDTTIYAPYSVNIDRATGQLTVTLPPFVPSGMLASPAGATHFKIVSAAAAIDFETGNYTSGTRFSDSLPIGSEPTEAIILQPATAANSTDPLFLVLGIEFYQEVNDLLYTLKNGAFNASALIQVSVV